MFDTSQCIESSTLRRVWSLKDIYKATNIAYSVCELQSFEKARKEETWRKTMDEEIATIEKNNTWELLDQPKGKYMIGLKWVYKIKYKEDGSI